MESKKRYNANANNRTHHKKSKGSSYWKRYTTTKYETCENPLLFMVTDVDEFASRDGAVVRLYGVDTDGQAMIVNVHNFEPYLYVNWDDSMESLGKFKQDLEQAVHCRPKQKWQRLKKYIVDAKIVNKFPIRGYHPHTQQFIKITLASPKIMSFVRDILVEQELQPYEAHVQFTMRCMVDCEIRGCGWMEIKSGYYEFLSHNGQYNVSYRDIAPRADIIDIPPLHILSFDIECAGRKGIFPEASVDPVIQIGNLLSIYGSSDEATLRNVFVLHGCSDIKDDDNEITIHAFDTEEELLLGWSEFVRSTDPDIFTGYNTDGFDFPYLVERANALGIPDFLLLGRIPRIPTTVEESQTSSKAFGTFGVKKIKIPGRVRVDLLPIIRKEHKLESYTLNNVALHFLNNRKADVAHSIITDLHNGSPADRARLAYYCYKDVLLPIRIMKKLSILENYVELARVTGLTLSEVILRGQQIRQFSLILREARKDGIILPTEPKVMEEGFTGATVLDPQCGFYNTPIVALDFKSLYPSIMIASNLCYTTQVTKDHPDATQTPNGFYFLNKTTRVGLLPRILEDLLCARRNAKRDMNEEKDPFKKAVLNGRQLALKVTCNSLYGFTGASTSPLTCVDISSSVTALGRQMIAQTKSLIEEQFTMANGYSHNAAVIYGDTDSVMVNFGDVSIPESFRLGALAAEASNHLFTEPHELELEKVYKPMLLNAKKRYAALKWVEPTKYLKIEVMGMESVRRDCCRLVRKTMKECFNKILLEADPDGAIAHVKQTVSNLLTNKVDMSDLILTRQLAAKYKNKTPHAELVKRMEKRCPGSGALVGDRVAFVMIQHHKKTKTFDMSEDPLYVIENDIPINYDYYVENQMKKPLSRIFTSILPNPEVLFQGDHMRHKYIPSSKSSPLARFVRIRPKCVECGAVLPATPSTAVSSATSASSSSSTASNSSRSFSKQPSPSAAVCIECMPGLVRIHAKHKALMDESKKECDGVWDECVKCQTTVESAKACGNKDCELFFKRLKLSKNLDVLTKRFDRFQIF